MNNYSRKFWQTISFGQIGRFSTSSVDKKKVDGQKEVNLINYMDVYRRNTVDNEMEFMKITASAVEKERSQVSHGDILFTPSSETPDDIGRSAVVVGDLKNTLHSYHTVRLRPHRNSLLDIRFSAWFANTEEVLRQFSQKCAGSTRYTLSLPSFQSVTCNIPVSLKEQRKIADCLDTVQKTIEKTEALIQKYQQIKQGLMHDLFTRGVTPEGKLRPHREQAPELYKETLIGWMPLQWDVVHVHDLCSDVVDCPHSTPVYKGHGIPCIRTADMEMGQLLTEQAYKVDYKTYLKRVQRLIPRNGDIIYSREGERLGIASPVRKEIVCLGQRVMLLRPLHETDPNFLLWSMNLPTFYRQVVSGLGATTSPHVNVGDIKKIMTCRPPKKEQEMIGKLIAAVQIKLEKEENFKNKLLLKKSGLMHDLLTGTVKVKVDE